MHNMDNLENGRTRETTPSKTKNGWALGTPTAIQWFKSCLAGQLDAGLLNSSGPLALCVACRRKGRRDSMARRTLLATTVAGALLLAAYTTLAGHSAFRWGSAGMIACIVPGNKAHHFS